ncbi:MAG: glycosyltransferase family 2 protein [Pseudobdellovibrionaceae bacterium]
MRHHVKVVVLSYNHPELTERTLKSVQLHFSDPEILLVHNGSLVQHQTRLQESFPKIEHLQIENNRGYPGGANAGLKQAFQNSEWVLFLTNDCQLLEWQTPPTPGLIAPLIWARKIGRVDSLGGSFEIHRAHLSHCKSEEEFSKAENSYVPGTAFWLHRDIFNSVGGFDESLEMFWEDVDFSLRVAQAGYPLQTDSKTQILHAVGKTTHKNSHYTTYLFQRNRKRISLKYAKKNWPVYFHLSKSWGRLGWIHLRRGDFAKLRLLHKAICD